MEKNINLNDVKLFYEYLNQGKTEIRVIRPAWDKSISNDEKRKEKKSFYVKSFEEINNLIQKYNGSHNIYIGLNERNTEGISDKDVKNITHIGHDIDAHDENSSLSIGFKVMEEIRSKCIELGLAEPLTICSGRGYWVFHSIEKIENTIDNVKKIKLFGDEIREKYSKDGIDIDSTVYNPSRIVRLPGTLNVSDKDNKVLSFITNKSIYIPDNKLKEHILSKKLNIQKLNTQAVLNYNPQTTAKSFFDFCLTNEIPKGERHKTISKNLAIYLYTHPDKDLLSEQWKYIQKGDSSDLINWFNRIEKEGLENFKINVGELINFTKKYKIPFDWKKTDEYKEFMKEKKAEKLIEKSVVIDKDIKTDDIQKDVLHSLLIKDYDTATELIVENFKVGKNIYSIRDDDKSEIWGYENGIYVPNIKSRLKEYTRDIIGKAYNSYIANLVINKVEADNYIEADDFFNVEYPDEIPLQNGIFNLKTRELNEFTPDKIFFTKMPITYNPEATCPNIIKHFKEVLLNEDDALVMFELFGYCLYKDAFLEKCFMFDGKGRNGKGKSLEIFKRFLGIENVSHVPLSAMDDKDFRVHEMFGKLANIAGDLSNTSLKETGLFKELTGRDTVAVKRKFKNSLKFMNYAKIIFACNELPRIYDNSDGFWNRWILFDFPYKFVKQEEYDLLDNKDNFKVMDVNHIEKILSQTELNGLFNEALKGLDRIQDNKSFSNSMGTQEVKLRWMRKADSFLAFMIDNLEEDNLGYISKEDIRKNFSDYIRRYRLKGVSDINIKIVLEEHMGVVESKITTTNLDRERVWKGIKWNNNSPYKK